MSVSDIGQSTLWYVGDCINNRRCLRRHPGDSLVTEFFLVSFRANGHLSVIRKLLEGVEAAETYNEQQQVRLSRVA